ncbi:MAG: SDR family oxidoreductase [Clostridiales bacterium]|nr:SDR family oxidoreductase [Clostridiales bacterium]
MLLENKTAVVTGCNRGIGKAILTRFAENGSNVIAVVRKESETFSQYCDELEKKNDIKIHTVYADFSSEEEVQNAVKEIRKLKLPIDILVNNIGIANPLNILTMTKMETIHQAFQVNLFSALLLTQGIAKLMMRQKSGSVVFVSSSAAFDGGSNIEYCASKGAINGAVKRLAIELGAFGIRVNAVAPGLTSTDMGNSMSEEDEAIALSMNVMKRKGDVTEIADSVLFLASDMASFITGQILRVDGGLLQ